jgi:hypothetical protein
VTRSAAVIVILVSPGNILFRLRPAASTQEGTQDQRE